MLIQKLVSGARRRLAQIAAVVLAAGAMTVMPAQAQLSRLIPVDGVTSFETQVQFDGRQNRVLYIRPVANPVGRVPAMVVLHYAGGDPEEMANLIAISQLVRDTGIWAVIPDALGRTWSFDPVRDRGKADDVGLITTIIDGTVAAYPIDSRRVWMFGFSAGGFMTMRYVCERPNRIAAAAYVSSTLLNTLRDNCAPSLPTPVLAMNGTADTRVNYNQRIGLSSAPDSALFFANLNRCLTPPVHTLLPDVANDRTTVELDSYNSCASNDPVRFYTINRGGHTWPGNDYQIGLIGRTTQDIDGTRVIYDFVRNFSR